MPRFVLANQNDDNNIYKAKMITMKILKNSGLEIDVTPTI